MMLLPLAGTMSSGGQSSRWFLITPQRLAGSDFGALTDALPGALCVYDDAHYYACGVIDGAGTSFDDDGSYRLADLAPARLRVAGFQRTGTSWSR